VISALARRTLVAPSRQAQPENQRSDPSQRPAPAAMMEEGAPVDLELVKPLRRRKLGQCALL